MAGGITGAATLETYIERSSQSGELFERAEQALPGGNTRTTIYIEPYPPYIERGEGCRIHDADGVKRLDFINNYTSLILGHCHPSVVEAVTRQAAQIMCVAAPSSLEIDLAEAIIERLPSVELVRFANSGTEGTMLALRAARAYTGREKLLKFEGGYHGTHDYAAVDVSAGGASGSGVQTGGAGLPKAVAETVLSVPFNDPDALERVVGAQAAEIAAVIVEPVMGAAGIIEPSEEFLHFSRELTEQHGIVLIFDEVISFRIAYGGAQTHYGVTPDLTTLGKIIGGGLPVGAFGGKREIMAQFDPREAGHVGHGGTFNANPLTMAAGLATLQEMTPASYQHLNRLGGELKSKLLALFDELGLVAQVNQVGSLFNIHFVDRPVTDYNDVQDGNLGLLSELYVAALNHGVAFTGRGMGCLSTPMTDADIDTFVTAIRESLSDVGAV